MTKPIATAHQKRVAALVAEGAHVRGFRKWVLDNTPTDEADDAIGAEIGESLSFVPDAYLIDGDIIRIYEVVVSSPVSRQKWYAWSLVLDWLDYCGYRAALVHQQNNMSHALPWFECARLARTTGNIRWCEFSPETRLIGML